MKKEKKITITFSSENIKAVNTIDKLFSNIYEEYHSLIDDENEKDITNNEEIHSVLRDNLHAILRLLDLVNNYRDMEP